MLERKLDQIQRQLQIKLEQIREEYQHKGNRGVNVEGILREFLRQYLPSYNRIGHGEIIDTKGNVSKQTDVIITNEYHPFLNNLSQPEIFFIEGIMCAGEVKSILTSADLIQSLNNCAEYKKLEIKWFPGTMFHSNESDKERFIKSRAFFLFAFESQLTLETIVEKINEFNADNNLPITSQIDAIFVLDRGNVVNFGDGNGLLKYVMDNGEVRTGYQISGWGKVIFEFLSWITTINHRMMIFYPILAHYLFTDGILSDDPNAEK